MRRPSRLSDGAPPQPLARGGCCAPARAYRLSPGRGTVAYWLAAPGLVASGRPASGLAASEPLASGPALSGATTAATTGATGSRPDRRARVDLDPAGPPQETRAAPPP